MDNEVVVDRVTQLQEEIIVRVKSIHQQKEDKATILASYRETIKALEAERDQLIQELDQLKDTEKKEALLAQADSILASNKDLNDTETELNLN